MSDTAIWTLVAVVVGLGVLALVLYLFTRMVFIAVLLFAWASSQGFVGIAAYIACWVFMFPIMVAVCLIGALLFPFIINENEAPQLAGWPSPKESPDRSRG